MKCSFRGVEPLVVGGGVLGDTCTRFAGIFLVVLRAVETDFLAMARHAHRYHLVGNPVDGVAHEECVGAYTGQHEDMVPEESGTAHALHAILSEEIVGEDTGKHRADDAAEPVGGKHIESIVEKIA